MRKNKPIWEDLDSIKSERYYALTNKNLLFNSCTAYLFFKSNLNKIIQT